MRLILTLCHLKGSPGFCGGLQTSQHLRWTKGARKRGEDTHLLRAGYYYRIRHCGFLMKKSSSFRYYFLFYNYLEICAAFSSNAAISAFLLSILSIYSERSLYLTGTFCFLIRTFTAIIIAKPKIIRKEPKPMLPE